MNSLDSAFCKKCGTGLPQEELQIAKQKLDELLKEGYTIFNEGRTEEAMMVAESVIMSNPTSAAALSLKGLCHERRDEFGEALEAYELVVELNPDSALDRIKVSQLRNKLSAPIRTEAKTGNRSLAIAGAAATIVLVVAVGGIFGSINARADDQVAKKAGVVDPGQSQPLADATQPKTQPANEQGNPAPETGAPAEQPVQQPQGTTTPPNPGGGLPRATDNGMDEEVPPVRVDVTGITGGVVKQPEKPVVTSSVNAGTNGVTKNSGGIDPKPDDWQTKPPVEETRDTGIYDIQVSGGQKPSIGGSEPISDANRAVALMKAADTKFMLQRFGEAATSYEAAMRAGANAGRCNQRLGDCYKHLGKQEAAISAYGRAAESYQKSGNDRAAASCRQAVKDLQGG